MHYHQFSFLTNLGLSTSSIEAFADRLHVAHVARELDEVQTSSKQSAAGFKLWEVAWNMGEGNARTFLL